MSDQRIINGKPEASVASESRRFLTVAEVARMFGTSSMTIYRAISAGEFPAVRVRGRLFVPSQALDEMVAAAIAEQAVVDAAAWAPRELAR
jgi:excisionase family DNA binding protein